MGSEGASSEEPEARSVKPGARLRGGVGGGARSQEPQANGQEPGARGQGAGWGGWGSQEPAARSDDEEGRGKRGAEKSRNGREKDAETFERKKVPKYFSIFFSKILEKTFREKTI